VIQGLLGEGGMGAVYLAIGAHIFSSIKCQVVVRLQQRVAQRLVTGAPEPPARVG
jgi:hypothetical protein